MWIVPPFFLTVPLSTQSAPYSELLT